DQLRERAEGFRERRRVEIGVDEHERPPGVDLDRAQAELAGLEALLAVGSRGRAERAVEPVRPGVVRALQRLPRASLLDDHGAAVAADVQEGAYLAGAVECDDD